MIDTSIPEMQYWVSGPALYVAGSFILTIWLALRAIRDMQSPFATRLFACLAIALMLLGLWQTANQEKDNAKNSKAIATVAALLNIDPTKKSRDLAEEIIKALPKASDIANELKATNSICYWYANLDAPRDSKGGFSQVVANTGRTITDVRWWVYPAGADQYSQAYKNSPYKDLAGSAVCFATGFAIYDPTIKPGKYGIDFTGNNDNGWRELLTINETEKEIAEEMVITRDGVGEILKQSWHRARQ